MTDVNLTVMSPDLPRLMAAMDGAGLPMDDDTVTVNTRYGVYSVERDKIVSLPTGLIGFAEHRDFALINLPYEGTEQFKLLQSVDDPSLSFYVLPADMASCGIEPADIHGAADQHGMRRNELVLLLVVAARKTPSGVELTANLRAPILLDADRRVGVQHVMSSEKYSLRHRLT